MKALRWFQKMYCTPKFSTIEVALDLLLLLVVVRSENWLALACILPGFILVGIVTKALEPVPVEKS